MDSLLIALGIIVVLVAVYVTLHKKLGRLRQSMQDSWVATEAALRRRYELIPKLVEIVKAHGIRERGTLEAVVQARNVAANNQGTPAQQAQTENVLNGALRQLFVMSENYPDLKANQNFAKLQNELGETETRISQARRSYNANVRELNNAVEMFPCSIIAAMGGFQCAEYFEIEEAEARGPVKVQF